jgi:hypothetical protein
MTIKAFPVPSGWNHKGEWVADNAQHDGMDLRDYFAAKAMQGLMTQLSPYGEDLPAPYSEKTMTVDEVAKYSYAMADAMMQERLQ